MGISNDFHCIRQSTCPFGYRTLELLGQRNSFYVDSMQKFLHSIKVKLEYEDYWNKVILVKKENFIQLHCLFRSISKHIFLAMECGPGKVFSYSAPGCPNSCEQPSCQLTCDKRELMKNSERG